MHGKTGSHRTPQHFLHHLLDVLSPDENATAGSYRELAISVLDDLKHRGRLPIFTVGTGLYLRALLEGLAELPERSEEIRTRLRATAEENPLGHLHRILRRLDPEAARKIASGDEQKLIRAIEIICPCWPSVTLSEVHWRWPPLPLTGWRILKIGLALGS